MIRIQTVFYLSAVAALPAGSALGASFDCSEARKADEVAICQDQALSRRDEIVSEAYTQAKQMAGKKAVNKATKQILRKRAACGSDIACISDVQESALETYRSFGANVNFGDDIIQSATFIDLDKPLRNEQYKINQEVFVFAVCNKFKRDVTLAFSTRTRADAADFTTRGWFTAKQGSCTDFGPFYKGDFLWTASADGGLWGKGTRLCVKPAAFEERYIPGQRCRKNFTMPFTHIFAVRDRELVTLTP